MADHINKWKNVKLMDGYHLARITTIPYPRFGIIINMIIHENIVYCVIIGTMPQCACPKLTNMSSHGMEKQCMYCKHLYCGVGFDTMKMQSSIHRKCHILKNTKQIYLYINFSLINYIFCNFKLQTIKKTKN